MRTIVFATLSLWALNVGHAQSTTGSVLGNVTDPSGSAVARAGVTLTNTGTSTAQKIFTDDAGDYSFSLIPSGNYRLTVEAAGFKQFIRDFALEIDQRARVDVPLTVGQVTESVNVSGQAVLLETDTSNLGQVITNKQVTDLPLNGRNPFALASLTPGVTPMGGFGIGLTGGRGGRDLRRREQLPIRWRPHREQRDHAGWYSHHGLLSGPACSDSLD